MSEQDLLAAYRSGQMSEAQWQAHVAAGDVAQPSAPAGQAEPFTFAYRNHRGEISMRTAIPERVWFGTTDWHREPQWLMTAFDIDKQAARDFALREILPSPGYGYERIAELLDANTRYIERARQAEAGKS